MNNKDKIFNNIDELLEYITDKYEQDSSQGLYYSTLLECSLNLIWDKKISEWINRYSFCNKFNVQPFGVSSYDELPCLWIDFCMIMMNELAECEKEQMRKSK